MDVTTAAPQPPSTPSSREMDGSLIRGVAWTGGVRWATQVASWLSTLVVIRLLTPADYGIMGMATLYLGLVQLLSEFGVGAAVVTLRDLSKRQVAQLNTVAVGFGVAGFLISAVIAAPMARFFSTPELTNVIIVTAIGFVASSFGVIPQSLLMRDLQFKLVAMMGAVQGLTAAAATISLAFLGFGYWALAIGNVLALLLASAFVVLARPHKMSWPHFGEIGSAIGFSSNIIVSRVSWYVYSNADFLIIGRILGKGALGVYSVGWTLATLVVDKVSAVIGRVAGAFFAATQNDIPALRRYLLRITEGLALVTFPAAVGMALVTQDLVAVVLGETWAEVVIPLQLLALYGIIRAVTPLVPRVLTVVGDSRYPAITSVVAAVVLPAGFYIGSHWGVTGVALTWVIGYPLILLPLYWRLLYRLDMTMLDYARALWPAVSGCLAMIAAVLAVRFLMRDSEPTLRLFSTVASGAMAYAGTILYLHMDRVTAIRSMLASARKGGAPADPSVA